MLLSIYTYVKDGLYWDFHVVDMLKHHLPFADEIVVNEGYSSDGTYERITAIDPKIRVFRTEWQKPTTSETWYLPLKDAARRECKGDWCLHLDADEFIPEWEFARVREYLAQAQELLLPVSFMNFYGNYKVFNPAARMKRKMILHRNVPQIEFWGDGANVRLREQPFDWGSSPFQLTCQHFGEVRRPDRLRQKWHIQGGMYQHIRRWFRRPSFLFNWFPHDWQDPDYMATLSVYEGPFIKAVRDNPAEFVRDDMKLYHLLKQPARTPELVA